MGDEWQIIECRGYKAYTSIDYSSKKINGRVYNVSWTCRVIEFSADSISGLYDSFKNALDEYYHECGENGVDPLPPIHDQIPPVVFKNYARLLPELEAASESELFMILRILDQKLGTMRCLGFLDVSSADQLNESKQEDVYDALKFILSIADLFLPKASRVSLLAKRLADDVEVIVSGHQPVFLKVDPFRGTKSSNPKHVALRIECACAVSALMRRGLTRNNACELVQDRLAKEGISPHKQGKAISVSTVRSYYNIVRASALKSGPKNYREGPEWPVAASHKGFYVDRSLVPFDERFRIEADVESDLYLQLKGGQNRDYPQKNGMSPLDNLIFNLRESVPLV